MNQIQQRTNAPGGITVAQITVLLTVATSTFVDEATCYYMREALKGTSEDLFKGDGERFAYGAANDHIALWDDLPSALKRDLKKAAKSPSRRR